MIGNFGPFVGTTIWTTALERSGEGALQIPISEDGYYLLNWYQWGRFVGRYRLSWRVE